MPRIPDAEDRTEATVTRRTPSRSHLSRGGRQEITGRLRLRLSCGPGHHDSNRASLSLTRSDSRAGTSLAGWLTICHAADRRTVASHGTAALVRSGVVVVVKRRYRHLDQRHGQSSPAREPEQARTPDSGLRGSRLQVHAQTARISVPQIGTYHLLVRPWTQTVTRF